MEPLRIIIVDNNTTLSQSLEKALRKDSSNIVIISALKALETLKKNPDFIFYCYSEGQQNFQIDLSYIKSTCQGALIIAKFPDVEIENRNILNTCHGIYTWSDNPAELREAMTIAHNHALIESKFKLLERDYNDLYDNARDMYFTVDNQRHIKSVSVFGAKYLGHQKEDLIGKDISLLVHPDDIKRVNEQFESILNGSESISELEFRKVKKNGSIIWVQEVIRKSRNINNEIEFRISCRDITKNREYEIGLKKAIEAAENANKAKSDFLASMSHEVRTPMNTVIGMLGLVSETELTEEQKEYIEIIQTASEHLLSIINDILDLSKIEANRIQFSEKEFNLSATIHEVVSSFKGNVEQKGLTISSEIDKNVPERLFGEPAYLKQILYNLLGNAIKFTHQGGCFVKVELANDPSFGVVKEGEIRLLFKVKDTGIGIATDMLDTIFDSFSQAFSTTKRKYEGTGLGLTISQKLTEKMGGNIWVESTENKGSTFYFTILFNQLKNAAETRGQTPIEDQKIEEKSVDSLNILVAEDNELNQKLITRLLKSRGHKSNVSENGLEAIEALRHDTYDMIFMDIQMPEMDGIEATISIRKDSSGDFDPNIPIVAVTAYAFDEDRQRCFEVGMNDFIPKPINNDKLNAVLDDIIEQKKQST